MDKIVGVKLQKKDFFQFYCLVRLNDDYVMYETVPPHIYYVVCVIVHISLLRQTCFASRN